MNDDPSEDAVYMDPDEWINYAYAGLERRGIDLPKEVLEEIYDLETKFMFEKGLTDDF